MTTETRNQNTGTQTQYGIQWRTKGNYHTQFGCTTLDDALSKAREIRSQGEDSPFQFVIFSHHYHYTTTPIPGWEKVDDNYTELWNIDGDSINLDPQMVLAHLWA